MARTPVPEAARRLALAALASVLAAGAWAQSIGVLLSDGDAARLAGMEVRAAELEGVELVIEDAAPDVAAQVERIGALAAAGAEAVVVHAVDPARAADLTDAAEAAGLALVFVGSEPINLGSLPEGQAFVTSDEVESATLAAFEACRLLRASGKASGARGYMLMGPLADGVAVQRAKDVRDVIGMDMCSFVTLLDERSANGSREEAAALIGKLVASGEPFDVIFASDDAMALGALDAISEGGMDPATIVVSGIGATEEGLAAVEAGALDATVLRDDEGQGGAALDAALALARGEAAGPVIHVAFRLVTRETLDGGE